MSVNASDLRRLVSTGFTVAELMITMAVGAILLVVAVPSYDGFISNQRAKTATYDLYASLVYARSEALKRNGNVFVTPNGAWTNGWIVTTNGARTYAHCTDGTTEADCLRVQAPLTDVSIAGDMVQLAYQRDGRVINVADPNDAIDAFIICNADGGVGAARRTISIDLTGRPNISLDGSCT